MTDRSTRRVVSAGVLLALALAACAPQVRVHGYVPSDADISRITPGVDDRFAVEEALGRPSSSGLLQDSTWYYVQSVTEQRTYNAPQVVDRTVLVVDFDPNSGIVRSIDRFGIEEGRIINLTTRTTDTGGRQLGVLEQLFGNILNLEAEQLVGDGG
jgi:outer membrane protein assembly factor BamE (lipoprotein component of BamABCDE complex)